jgi:hypothetical protein
LAPTFAKFIADPENDAQTLQAVRADIIALFKILNRDRIDFHDFHGRNITVVGGDSLRLMIIDGIGGATLIPLTQWSDRAFAKMSAKGQQRLLDAVDLAIAKAQC